ncbi:MAG TPA: ABC transporter permease [Micromonosporaceae bacterium]
MAVPDTAGLTGHPAVAALSYWLTQYRRTWRSGVFSSFVIPLMWLSAIGLGVGGYIDRGPDRLGVDYLSYLAPGLLASVILNSGGGECTWPVYGAIKWNRQYLAMLATPLRVVDVVLGHLGFVIARMLMNAVAFFVAMALFGTLHSAWAPLAVLAAVLTGLAAATPIYAFAVVAKSESRFPVLYRFGVVPVTLFSGVFFPIDELAGPLRLLAWVSPLWHGVELCRAATLGVAPDLPAVLHGGYLMLWAGAGFVLARRLLTRRLVV